MGILKYKIYDGKLYMAILFVSVGQVMHFLEIVLTYSRDLKNLVVFGTVSTMFKEETLGTISIFGSLSREPIFKGTRIFSLWSRSLVAKKPNPPKTMYVAARAAVPLVTGR